MRTYLIAICSVLMLMVNGCKPNDTADLEKTPPNRTMYVKSFENREIMVDVINIDSVDYLIAYTSRGVSICKK